MNKSIRVSSALHPATPSEDNMETASLRLIVSVPKSKAHSHKIVKQKLDWRIDFGTTMDSFRGGHDAFLDLD